MWVFSPNLSKEDTLESLGGVAAISPSSIPKGRTQLSKVSFFLLLTGFRAGLVGVKHSELLIAVKKVKRTHIVMRPWMFAQKPLRLRRRRAELQTRFCKIV